MNRALITLQGNYLYLANDGSSFDRLGVISVCIESVSSKEADDNKRAVDDYSCRDNRLVETLRIKSLEKFKSSQNDLRAAYNSMQGTSKDYSGRWVYEALQNMDDAMGGNEASTSIGTKGLGFLSFLEIAEEIAVFSEQFNFQFSKELASQEFVKESIECRKNYIPWMTIPCDAVGDEHTRKLKKQKYTTVVRLKVGQGFVDQYSERLKEIDVRFLLFSQNIDKLLLGEEEKLTTYTKATKALKSRRSGYEKAKVRIYEKSNSGTNEADNTYIRWRSIWDVSEGKRASCAFCLPMESDNECRPLKKKQTDPVIYNFFPTQECLQANIFLHITFHLSKDRNNLQFFGDEGDVSKMTDERDVNLLSNLKFLVKEICSDEMVSAATVLKTFSKLYTFAESKSSKVTSVISKALFAEIQKLPFVPTAIPHLKKSPKNVLIWQDALLSCFSFKTSGCVENYSELKIASLAGQEVIEHRDKLERFGASEIDVDTIGDIFGEIAALDAPLNQQINLVNTNFEERKKIHEQIADYIEDYSDETSINNIFKAPIFSEKQNEPVGLDLDNYYLGDSKLKLSSLPQKKIDKGSFKILKQFYLDKELYGFDDFLGKICLDKYEALKAFRSLDNSEDDTRNLEIFALLYICFSEDKEKTLRALRDIGKIRVLTSSKSGDEWVFSSRCRLTASWLPETEKGAKDWLKTLEKNDVYWKLPSFDVYKKKIEPCIKRIYPIKDPIKISKAKLREIFDAIGVFHSPAPQRIEYGYGSDVQAWDRDQIEDWRRYRWNARISYEWIDFIIVNLKTFIFNIPLKAQLEFCSNIEIDYARWRRDKRHNWSINSEMPSFLFYQLINLRWFKQDKGLLSQDGTFSLNEVIVSDKNESPFPFVSHKELERTLTKEGAEKFVDKFKLKKQINYSPDQWDAFAEVIPDNYQKLIAEGSEKRDIRLQLERFYKAFFCQYQPDSDEEILLPGDNGSEEIVFQKLENLYIHDLPIPLTTSDNTSYYEDRIPFFLDKKSLFRFQDDYDKKIINLEKVFEEEQPFGFELLSNLVVWKQLQECVSESEKDEFLSKPGKFWDLFDALSSMKKGKGVPFEKFKEKVFICEKLSILISPKSENSSDESESSEFPIEFTISGDKVYIARAAFDKHIPRYLADNAFECHIMSVAAVRALFKSQSEDEVNDILDDEGIPLNIVENYQLNMKGMFEADLSADDNAQTKTTGQGSDGSAVSESDSKEKTKAAPSEGLLQPAEDEQPKSPVGPEGNKISAPPKKPKRKSLTPSGKGRDRGHVVAGGDDVNPPSVLYDDEIESNKAMGASAEHHIGEILKREGHSNVEVLGGNNKGFDIEYFDEQGNHHYVEVKSLPGKWEDSHVMVTKSQFEHAQKHKENFSLYVVENARNLKQAIVTKIVNPSRHFTKLFLDSGWKEFGEKDSTSTTPVVGQYIKIRSEDEGQDLISKRIMQVQKKGTLYLLHLEGEEEGTVYKPDTMRLVNIKEGES